MRGKLLILVWGVAVFWLVTALPARYLGGGDGALVHSGTSALLCLVPAALTLAWASRSYQNDPSMLILVVLGGTGIRMMGVLLVGLVLSLTVPLFREQAFWLWMLVSYLFTLALETSLLLTGRGSGR